MKIYLKPKKDSCPRNEKHWFIFHWFEPHIWKFFKSEPSMLHSGKFRLTLKCKWCNEEITRNGISKDVITKLANKDQ